MWLLHATSDRLRTMTQDIWLKRNNMGRTAEDVLRAADLAASCLRGALPEFPSELSRNRY